MRRSSLTRPEALLQSGRRVQRFALPLCAENSAILGGARKLLGMFFILIVVTAARVSMSVQTPQSVTFKQMQFIGCKLYLNKADF